MNVAGIDYSTRAVDIVLISETRAPAWYRFELDGRDAFDRTRDVGRSMPGRAHSFWDDILAVGIEHPAGHHGTRDMLRIQGAILCCIPARMLVEPWPPAKWRKAVGLPGNAPKEQVMHHSFYALMDNPPETQRSLYRRDISGWPQDAHDAHLIAVATRQAITTTQAA